MHVTSNPFFAFHDDVFPAFSKNAVNQPRFPPSATDFYEPYPKTIIPDYAFSLLEGFEHISTIELALNQTRILEFQIVFNKIASTEQTIIGCKFFDGTTFLSFGTFRNGSIWVDSDYWKKRILLHYKSYQLDEFKIQHFSEPWSENIQIQMLEISSSNTSIVVTNETMSGLENLLSRKVRVFKFDRGVEIKNFIYTRTEGFSKINVIIPDRQGFVDPYALLSDGSIREDVSFFSPSTYEDNVSHYTFRTRHVVFQDQIYIFGGHYDNQRVIS